MAPATSVLRFTGWRPERDGQPITAELRASRNEPQPRHNPSESPQCIEPLQPLPILITLLLGSGCSDSPVEPTDRARPEPPSAAISDALHELAASPGFFFLPPMGSDVEFPAEFDAALDLDGDGHGDLLASARSSRFDVVRDAFAHFGHGVGVATQGVPAVETPIFNPRYS